MPWRNRGVGKSVVILSAVLEPKEKHVVAEKSDEPPEHQGF